MAAWTAPSHWRTRPAHEGGTLDMRGTIRLLRLLVTAVLTVALAIGVTAAVTAQDDEAILEEMVALEKSKLDPWYQNDIAAYVAEVSDETTYFDGAGSRLKGEAVREWLRGFEGLIPPLDYEIGDPSAVVRGDVVVWTFTIDMADPASGAPAGQWEVTKVLERTDDGWDVIHGHMSMPAPPPEEAPAE